jgi:hypothetical protein
VGRSPKRGESELTDECHQTPDKEENPSPKSTQAEEEQEFSISSARSMSTGVPKPQKM